LYKDVFNGAPFFENWTFESALEEYKYAYAKKGFKGLVACNDEILALTWGYDLPLKNSGRVNYSLLCEQLRKNNFSENAFYLSEVAVNEKFRGKNLGTNLVGTLKELVSQKFIVMRTKNPAMVAVAEKVFGIAELSFKEDSAYEGGMAYVYRV